jgi:hypothetical protein
MSDETRHDRQGDRETDETVSAPGDARLWQELAAMWHDHDPVPADLVEHVLVALATEDLDAEYELLQLVARTSELAGARGKGDALTISFSGESFALLLRVSGMHGDDRRVDGWVTPAREMRVTVKQKDRSWAADVDGHGRFELSNLPAGLSRFWLVGEPSGDDDEEQALFATPTFEL